MSKPDTKVARPGLILLLVLYFISGCSLGNPAQQNTLATHNQSAFDIQAEGGATSPPPGAIVIRRITTEN